MFNTLTKYCNKSQVAYQDILAILDPAKFCSSVQKFIDIYIRLPGIPSNGKLSDSDCIRVRICEGRFALLIREVGNNFSPFPIIYLLIPSHNYTTIYSYCPFFMIIY